MSTINNPRHPAAVIAFSVITCGIYTFYWIYAFSGEMKEYLKKEEINPATDLILCFICFPYIIYWAYRYSEFIQEAQGKAGGTVDNDLPLISLLMSFFGFFIVDMAIKQSKMNDVYSRKSITV